MVTFLHSCAVREIKTSGATLTTVQIAASCSASCHLQRGQTKMVKL